MKLGILAVYLSADHTDALLDLHLSRIARYTQVPYVIYASANRLAPELCERLTSHPQIRLCDIPHTALRDFQEHSYYLEHLVRIAIEDGATHIVVLHMDSFPIRQGWAEALAGRLSENCVFLAAEGVYTACLFFHRDFYTRCHPHFLLTDEDRADPCYRAFVLEHYPALLSGTGYLYCAYRNGLKCDYLRLTSARDVNQIGDVFDNMIFHLGHATWAGEKYPQRIHPLRDLYGRLLAAASKTYRTLVPLGVRKWVRWGLGPVLRPVVDRPLLVQHGQRIKQFLMDPEAYIAPIERRAALKP